MTIKNFLCGCIALAAFTPCTAQTQLSAYQPGVTAEGVVYYLPQTAVQLRVLVEKTSYEPGDFARYAQRYLRLNDVALEPSTTYRVTSITVGPKGVPDTTKVYSVKCRDACLRGGQETGTREPATVYERGNTDRWKHGEDGRADCPRDL